jgi:hypothetical protein
MSNFKLNVGSSCRRFGQEGVASIVCTQDSPNGKIGYNFKCEPQLQALKHQLVARSNGQFGVGQWMIHYEIADVPLALILNQDESGQKW